MIHNINFNKIVFIDWLKMFIIPEHVFYNLSYAITMSNMIKETIKNVFNNSSWFMLLIKMTKKKNYNCIKPIILLTKFSLNDLVQFMILSQFS